MGPLIANSFFSCFTTSLLLLYLVTSNRSLLLITTLTFRSLSNCQSFFVFPGAVELCETGPLSLLSLSLSLASSSLDAVLHVDGYWLFFLALAPLCLSLPLSVLLCQPGHARPTVHSTPTLCVKEVRWRERRGRTVSLLLMVKSHADVCVHKRLIFHAA